MVVWLICRDCRGSVTSSTKATVQFVWGKKACMDDNNNKNFINRIHFYPDFFFIFIRIFSFALGKPLKRKTNFFVIKILLTLFSFVYF